MEPVVLLIDSDLGFLFWLGRALDRAGYEAYPAKTISDAVTLLAQSQIKVSVLIVNCTLPGAPEFITNLCQARRQARVISLVGSCDDPGPCPAHIDAVCKKPSEISERSKNELVQLVHKVLSLNSLAY